MSPEAILRRPGLRPRLRAAGLALPLMAFVGVTFVAPLASMLAHSLVLPQSSVGGCRVTRSCARV